MHTNRRIILASSSPRRKDLLKSLLSNFNLSFEIIPANITEILPRKSNNPGKLAVKLAQAKVRSVAENHKGIILGADTIVVLDGLILGKPESNEEARRMLSSLSDNSHNVYTGLTLMDSLSGNEFTAYEKTKVLFRRITKKEIDYYVKSGSPFDKAGGYGIQDDFGSIFVSKVCGDFFNVVGLPVVKTYLGLQKIMGLGL